VRLFAGIPMDDAARAYVATAVEALKREGVRARWVPAENWHVTLAFLGDVDSASYDLAVRGHALLAQNGIAPFALRLSCVGAFPDSQRPRVIWVGDRDESAEFATAALAVRGAFLPLGFRFDDGARAHVTVGRSNGSGPLVAPPLESAISMTVTRIVLFESVRGPAGVRYVEREVVILDPTS
jgi:2'-5' RNA ligase